MFQPRLGHPSQSILKSYGGNFTNGFIMFKLVKCKIHQKITCQFEAL